MSPRLAELLECEPTASTVAGVEREYRVLDPSGLAVDFRRIIPGLALPGGGLDPGDPNAHHLPSGVLLTADGHEAEAATPPIAVARGFTWQATSWAELAEDAIVEALPHGLAIEGYSTHLNVSVGDDVVAVADLFAQHFALGMMLLLDRRDSPGLLVRPRPGRLELGGDFVDGEQLRAALTYAVAATRCCSAARRTRSNAALPPPIRGRLVRAKHRPGWFIAPGTYARDLTTAGRDALLRCEAGSMRAGDALARAWLAARGELADEVDLAELAVVDDTVEARRPLPREHACGPDRRLTARRSVFAELQPRERAELRLRVRAMSWAAVAFNVRSTAGAEFHVVVPRRWLRSFLERFDDGTLDEPLLRASADSTEVGGPLVVLGELDPRRVVPPEPPPRRPWLRRRCPELVGALAGAAAVAIAHRFWPW